MPVRPHYCQSNRAMLQKVAVSTSKNQPAGERCRPAIAPVPPRSMTMMNRNRREFLADVGKGMLVASVGPALAADLGLARAFAGDDAKPLSFGDREPLVALMQETP